MSPYIFREAERLVREKKAPDFRAACSLIAKRKKPKNTQPPRELRLPYRDD